MLGDLLLPLSPPPGAHPGFSFPLYQYLPHPHYPSVLAVDKVTKLTTKKDSSLFRWNRAEDGELSCLKKKNILFAFASINSLVLAYTLNAVHVVFFSKCNLTPL